MLASEKKYGDFRDASLVRTHAQSHAEIESSRARYPYSARGGIFPTTALRAAALQLKPSRFLAAYGVPWKGTVPQRVRIPPGKLSLQPVAIGADDGGNDIVRSTSMERVALGDSATMRAATRVNAEQASKIGMREPTRP